MKYQVSLHLVTLQTHTHTHTQASFPFTDSTNGAEQNVFIIAELFYDYEHTHTGHDF